MNGEKLSGAIAARLKGSSPAQQFRFWVSLYGGLPYMGGKENFTYGADCSGTVCGPLYLMGYDIRCTANDLYRELFTDEVSNFEPNDEIVAVFYKTQALREHFGVQVSPGYVTHVAPVIGRYVVQNAWEPYIMPMTTKTVYEYYNSRGFDVEWRRLNGDALQRHHVDRDLLYGLDPRLEALR